MMTSQPRGRRRSVLKGVAVDGIVYLLVTALAALTTPMFGGRNPALAIWLGGGLVLCVVLARSFSRSFQTSSRAGRMAAALVSALGVSAVVAFISFVVMVNIWERLGAGH